MHRPSISKLAGLLTGVGALCALASFWVTYEGLWAESGNRPFSLALSGVACLVSVVILHVLCQILPRSDRRTRLKLILGVVLPGLISVLLTSTSMAIRGMAAPAAQQLELRDLLDQAEARLEQGQIAQRHQAKAVSLLRTQANQVMAMAEREEAGQATLVEKGARSRSTQDLQVLAEAYAAAADIVEQDQARRVTAAQQASEVLSQLRALVDGTRANAKDVRSIEQHYLDHLRDLNVHLAELERAPEGGDVLAPVAQVLAAQRDTPFESSRRRRINAKLDPAQQRRLRQARARDQEEKQGALTALQERNQKILDDTQAALAQLVGDPQPSQHLQRRSAMEAVWAHRLAVAHLIAFPIVLDMAVPLIALVVLSLMASTAAPASASPLFLPEPPIYETPSPRMRLSQLRSAGSQQRHVGAGQPDR